MRVVIQYLVEGELRSQTCDYDRLDHVIAVCEEKGFEVVDVENLS